MVKKKQPDSESLGSAPKRPRIEPTFRVAKAPANRTGTKSIPTPSGSKSRVSTIKTTTSGRRSQHRTVTEERPHAPVPNEHLESQGDDISPDPPLPDIESLVDLQPQKPKRKRANTTSVWLR